LKLKPPIEKYIDQFWEKNIDKLEIKPSNYELDKIVHKFIHDLLIIGDDDLDYTPY